MLENKTNFPAQHNKSVVWHSCQIFPFKQDAPAIGAFQAVEAPQQGGFTRPGPANNAQAIASLHRKADILQGGLAAKLAAYLFNSKKAHDQAGTMAP
ncbi:hypothetical protein ACI01nite_20760 [Acetobacter cibinongensis]|uniref:Uncharacterized protein n=1 Tax=Acetobacter cibinongensis TaxID=146475 RepID=A0A0D6N0M7_9PROT|nr:hypothetical protein Abci_005_083 [Acetobacter cibinongensis]GBQ12526.1 hypothetical protein AA0482_0284 [Acetobacter cibinongensis NRIC 0482]GEL59474.1 hypothetical protein ACI01nite_20760 [Acetobacter cibinongensis]